MVDPLGMSPAVASVPAGSYEASALSQLAPGALLELGAVGELLAGGVGTGVGE
jgi:hypothetical protein